MRDCVALGNVAQDLVAVQLADKSQFRRRGNMRQDERKADLLQHPVRHRVVGLRLADDAFQIESLVEIERRQTKETRTVTLTPQIGPPQVRCMLPKSPGTMSLSEECPMALPSIHHARTKLRS